MQIKYVAHNQTEREIWLSISDTPCREVEPEYYEESNHETRQKGEKKHIESGVVNVDEPAGYVTQGYRPVMIWLPVDDLQAKITEEINAYVLQGVSVVPPVETEEEINARIDKELADVEAIAAIRPDLVEKKLQDRQKIGILKVVDPLGADQPNDKIKVVK